MGVYFADTGNTTDTAKPISTATASAVSQKPDTLSMSVPAGGYDLLIGGQWVWLQLMWLHVAAN